LCIGIKLLDPHPPEGLYRWHVAHPGKLRGLVEQGKEAPSVLSDHLGEILAFLPS